MAKNRTTAKCIRVSQEELEEIKRIADTLRVSDTDAIVMGIKLLGNTLGKYPPGEVPTKLELRMAANA